MQVKVHLDEIGESTDSLIEQELEKKKLPRCFGSNVPIIIEKIHLFDGSTILAPQGSIRNSQIANIPITRIIESEVITSNKTPYVLTVDGVSVIEQHKTYLVKTYVDKLSSCISCECFDKCNLITRNYLKLLEIDVLNQILSTYERSK